MSKDQGPKSLAAAGIAARTCSTVGNSERSKLVVYATPKGRQFASVLETQSLRVFVEPLDVAPPRQFWHRRTEYPEDHTRHNNLYFDGCRLGKGHRADYLGFDDVADFAAFLDWYKTL